MYLFRISLTCSDVWNKKYKSKRTMYMVGNDKENIKQMVLDKIKEGYSITSIAKLAEQFSGNLFIKEEK